MEKQKCVICRKDFYGFGNNPNPIKSEGVCCDNCNFSKVIPARLNQFERKEEKNKTIPKP